MMVESSLQLLRDRLARPLQLPQPGAGYETWIDHDVEAPSPFIEPTVVKDAREGEPSGAPVILIAATAAVGKSFLAKHLATTTGNPYWDLSRAQVGTNFFSGTIVKAYGGLGYARFEELLSERGVTLVVDAGDEALVRAGLANYLEALQDLASLVGGAPADKAAAVILGRPESIDFAAYQLDEAGIPWERLGIEFFTEEASRQLVHAKAQKSAKFYSHENVERFINLVFGAVRESVGGDSTWNNLDVRSFLGYAPVLDSLGALASEANPFAALQNLKNTTGSVAIWIFLKSVIDELLEREYGKLVGPNPDPMTEPYYRYAYEPARQLRMLMSDQPLSHIEVPAGLADEIVREVRSRVEGQFRDHPFFRTPGAVDQAVNPLTRVSNVAFRDYLAAWAVTQNELAVQEDVARLYADNDVQPSPILVRLMQAFAENAPGPLPLSSLGMIGDSVATSLDGRRLAFTVEQIAVWDDHAQDVIDEATVTVALEGAALAEFPVRGSLEGTVRLNRGCRGAQIDLPNATIVIGSGQRDFELGPDVTLRARAVVAAAESFRVVAGSPISIECKSFTSSTQSIIPSPGVSMELLTGKASYPWSRFHKRPDPEEPSRTELLSAGMELRQTLSWFLNKSMTGALRYPSGALEVIRRKGRIPAVMFDYLSERGNIKYLGNEYLFDPPASVASIRALDLEDVGLVDFLREYSRGQRN